MTAAEEPTPVVHRYTWPSIVIAAVFGLLYAYVLWGAIGNLIELPAALGDVTPWWILILDVALPLVVWVVAFILGRRQSFWIRALYFFIGATVLSVGWVGSIAYVQTH